ncbi:MAG: hypothetical protein AB1716_05120 [Planctomycetota bacterium]
MLAVVSDNTAGPRCVQCAQTTRAPAAQAANAVKSTAAQRLSFGATLRALAAEPRLADSDSAVVRQTAQQLGSELFFKPLLAEMRKFPLGRAFADGGRTEAVFGEQLDQRLADSVAAAAPGLVERLMEYFAACPSLRTQQQAGQDQTA